MKHRWTTGPIAPLLLAAALGAAVPGGAPAQEALSYTVRDAGGGYAVGPLRRDSAAFDFSADTDPTRVVQGPTFTWVGARGQPLNRETALLILHDNVPLRPGPGNVMLKGWDPAAVTRHDTFHMALTRGNEDLEIVGDTARHYRLEAITQWVPEASTEARRFEVAADLWVRRDLPHSWAPFGIGTQRLPAVMPRLRAELGRRLDSLGLVVRAAIYQRFSVASGGDDEPASEETVAFLVSDLERVEAPPAPGPVVDRTVMEELERRVLEDPGPVCVAAAAGHAPDTLRGSLRGDARFAVLSRITEGCESPELYFGILEDRLESEPDAVCSAVESAEDAETLAAGLLTEPQLQAFTEFLSDADRTRFLRELERFCVTRGG